MKVSELLADLQEVVPPGVLRSVKAFPTLVAIFPGRLLQALVKRGSCQKPFLYPGVVF